MTWQGRLAIFGVVASVVLAMEDVLAPVVALPLLAVALALAWLFNDGFWKSVASGVAGGALAGLIILGPGLRLAMRMVAIMDPFETPEFSIGGTMFIVIGIGGIFGGIFGIIGNLIRAAVGLKSIILSGILLGALVTGVFLTDPNLREEFTDLGAGLWVNLAMFGSVTLAYGIAAMNVAGRFEAATSHQPVTKKAGVPA